MTTQPIQAMKQALEMLTASSTFFSTRSALMTDECRAAAEELRTAIQQAEAKTGVRCEGCGYMTHHREHMGCVRAAKQFTHPSPGAPVGQAPSVWNSIQIASWIGSQLMREPSMFERNAVCKFVRSLGRHPTLLKHSPKDTHLAPGVPDDVVRDAERYRWLRATTNWASSNGERIDVRNNPELWDSAIDAAMLASPAQKGQP